MSRWHWTHSHNYSLTHPQNHHHLSELSTNSHSPSTLDSSLVSSVPLPGHTEPEKIKLHIKVRGTISLVNIWLHLPGLRANVEWGPPDCVSSPCPHPLYACACWSRRKIQPGLHRLVFMQEGVLRPTVCPPLLLQWKNPYPHSTEIVPPLLTVHVHVSAHAHSCANCYFELLEITGG